MNSARSISPGWVGARSVGNRREMSPFAGLVVVRDLDFIGISVLPTETDAILLVDPNAVLAPTTSAQWLESISWWNRKMSKIPDPVDLIQLSSSNGPQGRRTHGARGFAIPSIEHVFRALVEDRGYHASCYNG